MGVGLRGQGVRVRVRVGDVPARPRCAQIAPIVQVRLRSGVVAPRTIRTVTPSVSTIRRRWPGYASRKTCAAKIDSCAGSANRPVTGCLSTFEAAGAGSRSLRGASRARSAGSVDASAPPVPGATAAWSTSTLSRSRSQLSLPSLVSLGISPSRGVMCQENMLRCSPLAQPQAAANLGCTPTTSVGEAPDCWPYFSFVLPRE